MGGRETKPWVYDKEEAKELTGTIIVVDGQELPKVCSA
jgi:hypothetical protein